MKIFFLTYFIIGALGSVFLYLFSSKLAAISFALGCAIMMLNVVGLQFAWGRILVKKQVAVPMGVIVFKYAILGFIIYRIVTSNSFELSWFAAGFSVVLISAVATLIRSDRLEQ